MAAAEEALRRVDSDRLALRFALANLNHTKEAPEDLTQVCARACQSDRNWITKIR